MSPEAATICLRIRGDAAAYIRAMHVLVNRSGRLDRYTQLYVRGQLTGGGFL